MGDELGLALLIYGIFFCVHVLVCGAVSLIALIIAERNWKMSVKYRHIIVSMLLPGIFVFILFTWIGSDMNENAELAFWIAYSLLTIAGLVLGLRRAKKKAQALQHADQGQ